MKTKFKVISFALVIIISLSGFPSDIVAAKSSGETLRDLGILKGDLTGDLLLDQPLKRQDAIVLLSRLLGVEDLAENFPGNHTFTDVTDPYYDSFIAWAEDSGLTEGIGGGLFGFDQYLTNQQLLAFLLRALGHEFFGEEYSLVPGKALELEISPNDEVWGDTTTRQLMADRTVTLLRKGRIKYGNITLERALALNDDSIPSNGQLFQLDDFHYKKGSVLMTFSSPAQDYNSSRSNRTVRAVLDEGPDIQDIKLTYQIINADPVVRDIRLTKVFYDPATGQLLASFEPGDIPTESQIEMRATYLENRETIAHEAAHVVQQRSPGTYEPGEILLLLEEILRDLLPPFSGSFSSDEFNNDELKQLSGVSGNPLYEQNSFIGTSTLSRNVDSFFDVFTEITLLDNIITPNAELLFSSAVVNGESLDIDANVTTSSDGRTFETEMVSLSLTQANPVIIVNTYMNKGELVDAIANDNGLSVNAVNSILTELSIQLHLSQKPDAITSTSVYGLLTVHIEKLGLASSELKTVSGVIVGNSFSNPELDDEVIVALTGKGMQDLKVTYKVHDYGDEFTDEYSAYNSFLRYLDPDDDGDGLDTDSDDDGFGDLVFRHNHKPINVTKPVDKATPLLMVTDGGLGDHVTLHLKNGEVMYWHDGIDNDCDGTVDDDQKTIQYIDSITIDEDTNTLRVGRNPQTGKAINIPAKTTVVITNEDGSVTSMTYSEWKELIDEETTYAYAKTVTNTGDENALLIHIIQNSGVVYVETREIDTRSTKILWTNIDDLTEEETNFLLSGEIDAEIFVFRQEFGPVQGSSYRYWVNQKMAEAVEYTPSGTQAKAKKVARFKAGAALAGTVKSADSGGSGCNVIIIGSAPATASYIKIAGIDGESERVMVVDSFFDVFTELSVDFRGHVTVLK